jgi:integrase
MAKKLVLPEYDLSIDLEDAGFNQRLSYETFLEYFKSIPVRDLEVSIKKFDDEREKVNQVLKKSIPILREQPLLAAFLLWCKRNYVKKGFPDYPKMLIDEHIISFEDENGDLLVIKNIQKKYLLNIIENMRCRKDLDSFKIEMLVLTFMEFIRWMFITTRMFTFEIEDPDRSRISRRALEYDEYITFISKLDDKCRLVAKLLFFGGSRTLSEILNIEVKDVNFQDCSISFESYKISYPKHVLEDIRSLSITSETGKIFSGRKNAALNPATIFRKFKEVSLQLGLDPVYTPKILTTDI